MRRLREAVTQVVRIYPYVALSNTSPPPLLLPDVELTVVDEEVRDKPLRVAEKPPGRQDRPLRRPIA